MTVAPIREYDIEIDIITGKVKVLNIPINNRIEFIKGDYRANKLNVHLKSNGNPYLIGENNVKIAFARYDREIIVMNKDVDELYVVDNIIQCTLTSDTMEIVGRQVLAEVLIYDTEGRRLTSGRFSFYVIKGIIDDTKIRQVAGYDLFEKLTLQVENMLSDIEENVLPNEEKRELAEELRELAEQNRVDEFNDKLIEISNAVNIAIEKANLANDKALLAEEATNTINSTNESIIQAESQRATTFENMMTSADQAKRSLDLVIFDASEINDILESNISVANTLNDNLGNVENGTIKRADQAKAELESAIVEGKSTKNVLDGSIQVGNTTKSNVDESVLLANNSKQALDSTIEDSIVNKQHLEGTILDAMGVVDSIENIATGSIKRANDSRVALDDTIVNSTVAKGQLEGVVLDSNVAKENLDISTTTASTTKTNLDASVSNANTINDTLSNAANGTIKVANDINTTLEETVGASNTSKSNLDNSVSSANQINNTLANAETGAIKLANDVNSVLNTTIADASTSKTDLDNSIGDANTSKSNLDESISTATTKKTQLDSSVNTADTSKSNLDTAITSANNSKSSLDISVENAITGKSNLDSSIFSGNTLKSNLDGSISAGATLKSDLDTNIVAGNQLKIDLPPLVDSANTAKTSLDESVSTSIAKKSDLDGSIDLATTKDDDLKTTVDDANEIKTSLDSSIDTANTIKTNLDQSIADGDIDAINDKIGVLSEMPTTEKGSLAGAVGEVKNEVTAFKEEYIQQRQLPHFNHAMQEYINLDQFWNNFRDGKIYTTEFNQFSVSPSPNGTKLDDNADLIMEPSTNTVAGRDDYSKIGLFKPIEVNAYVDEDDDYHVIAMDGDGRFKRDGTMGDVYVMSMAGYQKRYETDTVWGVSYSDTMHPGFEILDEAVKPDGTIRPYLLHAKYVAGRNPHENNNLASISGVYPEFVNMSHNGQITEFKKKGSQYSGKTSHDDYYVQLMMWLKYATTHSQSIMKGCEYYYVQYTPSIIETDTNRFVITNAQANNLLVGSTVSIGDYGAGSINADRNAGQNYNVVNRVKILAIEPLEDGLNSAIVLDTDMLFSTTSTSTITTYPWNSGGCDNVLGVDGSPYSNTSSKEPFIINGIEMMVGGYEVLQNLIILNNAIDNRIDVYANYDCTTYATSITSAYDLVGQLAQTNNTWKYGSKISIPKNHPSVILVTEAEASSTTGTGDGIYTNPPSTGGTRVWRSLGYLSLGTITGLRCLFAVSSLAHAYWYILGRLSATGQSRRRAGVN